MRSAEVAPESSSQPDRRSDAGDEQLRCVTQGRLDKQPRTNRETWSQRGVRVELKGSWRRFPFKLRSNYRHRYAAVPLRCVARGKFPTSLHLETFREVFLESATGRPKSPGKSRWFFRHYAKTVTPDRRRRTAVLAISALPRRSVSVGKPHGRFKTGTSDGQDASTHR